jgi:hypothetical protein
MPETRTRNEGAPLTTRMIVLLALLATTISVTMLTTTATSVYAQQGQTQQERVGIHDNGIQTSGEGANQGGVVTGPTIPGGQVKANCFGKVISHEAQEHKEDPDEGTLGEHSSDPVPEIPGHETPRQGIGNQDQGHPAAHGAFNSQFDPDDAENVEENC